MAINNHSADKRTPGRALWAVILRALPAGLSYVGSSASLLIASASQLITFAVLARHLGVDQFSTFVAITAFTAVAVQLCGLGAMDSLARCVARDRSTYRVMLGHNLILTGSTGIVLMLIGLASLPFLFPLHENMWLNLGACALMILANVILLRFIMMTEQVFIAHSNFAQANWVAIASAVLRAVTAVTACLAFGVKDVAHWAVWHFVANGTVALLCVFWIRPLGKPIWQIVRPEIRLGVYFSTQFIFRALRQNADLIALGFAANPEVVSSYAVARRVLDSSYISVDALFRLAYPGSAKATAAGLHLAGNRLKQLFALSLMISIPTIAIIFFGAQFLPLLFGAEYVSLVFLVQVLSLAGIFVTLYAAPLELLSAAGHQKERAAIFNTSSVVGAVVVSIATYQAELSGTLIATYVIEFATVVASWTVTWHLFETSQKKHAVLLASA